MAISVFAPDLMRAHELIKQGQIWLLNSPRFKQVARSCCRPIKQCRRGNIWYLRTDSFDYYCKRMGIWLSRTVRLSSGLQMAVRFTEELYTGKKFASLFTLWWVITVFFMTHPEGVYGLLKVRIQGINHFGITPVWLFKMMGIWSFMISAQAIRAGPVSGSFLVEFQSQRTGWWRSCLMVCNFLNGGFNCHFLPSLANGLSIHGLLRTGGGCKQSGLYGSVWHL